MRLDPIVTVLDYVTSFASPFNSTCSTGPRGGFVSYRASARVTESECIGAPPSNSPATRSRMFCCVGADRQQQHRSLAQREREIDETHGPTALPTLGLARRKLRVHFHPIHIGVFHHRGCVDDDLGEATSWFQLKRIAPGCRQGPWPAGQSPRW